MSDLERLKDMIDEENFPYFEDSYLVGKLDEIDEDEGITIQDISRELCLVKSGIEEIKLGDVTIPSPREHFLMLAARYRNNCTGVVTRADEQ